MRNKAVQGIVVGGVLLGLNACGQVGKLLPPQPVQDITLPLHSTANMTGKVMYLDSAVFRPAGLNALPFRFTITGDAKYSAAGGNLQKANVYARGDLLNLPSGCNRNTPGLVVCDLSTETAQKIGTLDLMAGTKIPFSLSGQAFTDAVKGGSVYYGLEVVQGAAQEGESLDITSTYLHMD